MILFFGVGGSGRSPFECGTLDSNLFGMQARVGIDQYGIKSYGIVLPLPRVPNYNGTGSPGAE